MPKTKSSKPVWLKHTDKEVKEIILKLAKKGLTSEKIGLALRDTYGIPKTKIYKIKISRVLKENNIYEAPDIKNLSAKLEKLKKHIEKNQQDKKTKRAHIITFAKLKKQKEYQNKNK